MAGAGAGGGGGGGWQGVPKRNVQGLKLKV